MQPLIQRLQSRVGLFLCFAFCSGLCGLNISNSALADSDATFGALKSQDADRSDWSDTRPETRWDRLAQNAEKPTRPEPSPSIPRDEEDYVRSSRSYRKSKRVNLFVEALGFILVPAVGFRVAYNFTPDLALETNLNAGGLFGDTKALMEVKAKYFLLDSLYVSGGFGREAWIVRRDVAKTRIKKADGSFEPFQNAEVTWNTSNNGLALALGNQWTWGYFTLGCDWVGGLVNLHSTFDRKKPQDVEQDEFERYDRNVKSSFTGHTVHVLRLYLGASF